MSCDLDGLALGGGLQAGPVAAARTGTSSRSQGQRRPVDTAVTGSSPVSRVTEASSRPGRLCWASEAISPSRDRIEWSVRPDAPEPVERLVGLSRVPSSGADVTESPPAILRPDCTVRLTRVEVVADQQPRRHLSDAAVRVPTRTTSTLRGPTPGRNTHARVTPVACRWTVHGWSSSCDRASHSRRAAQGLRSLPDGTLEPRGPVPHCRHVSVRCRLHGAQYVISPDAAGAVQAAFDELGRLSFAEHSLESVLERVTDLAAHVLPGEPVTSVTIVDRGKPTHGRRQRRAGARPSTRRSTGWATAPAWPRPTTGRPQPSSSTRGAATRLGRVRRHAAEPRLRQRPVLPAAGRRSRCPGR